MWRRVRRARAVDAVLVALAVLDHWLFGSKPTPHVSCEVVDLFQVGPYAMPLRIVRDVDERDSRGH